MPPWILAAIPIVLAALGLVTLIIRPVIRIWAENLSDKDLERMIGVLKGVVAVAVPLAEATSNKVDDQVVKGVVAASLDEFISEYGRRPKISTIRLQNVAAAVVAKADKAIKDNAAIINGLPAVSVGVLGKLDLKARP